MLRARIWPMMGAAAVAALLVVAAQIAISPALRFDYLADLAAKRRYFVQPYAVLLGDSHLVLGDGWCWRLRHIPLSCINMAEGGLMLPQIAPRADRALRMHPRFFVLIGGTNDILLGRRDANGFAAAYADFVRKLRGSGGRVIVMSVPPLRDPALSRVAADFNRAMRPMVERAGGEYLDLWPSTARHGRLRPELTADGIHLRLFFYPTWTALLDKAIRRGGGAA